MKKMIKGIGELAGMALVLAGLVVCMCEKPDLEGQLVTMCIGFGMIVAGALVSILAKWGEKDVA